MKFVYLAGPIAGCDHHQAKDWRTYVAWKLHPHGIRTISPLRCEPRIGEKYELEYAGDAKFGSARALTSKNIFDIRNCDAALVYMPKSAPRVSVGTLIELGGLHFLNKSIVSVTDDPYLNAHPVFNYCSGWMLPTLDDGIEVLIGVLSHYK